MAKRQLFIKKRNPSADDVRKHIASMLNKSVISESIINTPVDDYKYALSAPHSASTQAKVRDIYERYKITQYESMEQYREVLATYGLNKQQQDIMVRDYMHREKLMVTGQYEELRYKAYKENYIKAMRESGMPEYAIDNIEKLSIKDWRKLAIAPADMDNKDKYALPNIEEFHYQGNITFLAKDIEDKVNALAATFQQIGLTFEYGEENGNIQAQYTRERLKSVRKALPRSIVDVIEEEFDENLNDAENDKEVAEVINDYYDTIIDNLAKRRKKVIITKKGNKFYPGLGSTANPKKREFIMAIYNKQYGE